MPQGTEHAVRQQKNNQNNRLLGTGPLRQHGHGFLGRVNPGAKAPTIQHATVCLVVAAPVLEPAALPLSIPTVRLHSDVGAETCDGLSRLRIVAILNSQTAACLDFRSLSASFTHRVLGS